MNTWQPIEAAPLDGTEVELYTKQKTNIHALFQDGSWLDIHAYVVKDPTHFRRITTPVVKTRASWEETDPNLDLDEYIFPGDECDESLMLYVSESVPKFFMSGDGIFHQGGDTQKHDKDGHAYYMTFQRVGDVYVYLGVLPEFAEPANEYDWN